MQNNNFCALPFGGMQIWTDGSLKPCCAYQQHLHQGPVYHVSNFDSWWNEGLIPIRNNFKNGNPPTSCSLCFRPEFINSGVRVSGNAWMTNNINNTDPLEFPENIDITFGNLCNLKCLMCTSVSSSRIEAEYKQNKVKFNSIGIVQANMPPLNRWWEDKETLNKVKKIVSRSKYVNFSGGEPLLTNQIVDILHAIPATCFVEINTNLTKLTDDQISALQKFDKVRISISLDGIGQHHEYIRYESNWNVIEENINKLINSNSPNIEVAFSYVLQHTSIYTFPAFWNYFKQYNNTIRVSEVVPNTLKDNMMTINSVTGQDVDNFVTWYKNNPTPYNDIIDVWLSNYKFDTVAHENFKQYVTTLDQIRGCDFRSTFNPTW